MTFVVHCDKYWKEMNIMLKNFIEGKFPINQGCTHNLRTCKKCKELQLKEWEDGE